MMMKKLLYYICLMVTTCWLTACSADWEPSDTGGSASDNSVNVELRLGVSSSTLVHTRAGSDYSDVNMQPGELMRNWLVVIVDKDNKIVAIKQNEKYGSSEVERAKDECWEKLSTGTYTFYSFANIQPSELGLDGKKAGDELPADFFENQKYTVTIPTLTYTDHWTDYQQDYFPKGIPMSNKQVVTITADTKAVDLEVIRMVAKVKLSLTNNTDHDITIKSLTLSDITPNEQADNLMLLPSGVEDDEQGISHVSKPNLAITDSQKKVETYNPSSQTNGHDFVIGAKGDKNICFYVNESEATAENKYIVLQLKTTDENNNNTVNRRFAMLDWKQLCRNDYRIIPIKLDDYAIEWKVEAFTPIGTLPKVEDDGENLTIDFRYYGEFHIKPMVKKLSTGKDLDYSEEPYGDVWNYKNLECIVATPEGEAGTNIFDKNPTWVKDSRRIEGEMGNRTGTAIYKLMLNVYKLSDSEWIQLTRKVRFAMTAVNYH